MYHGHRAAYYVKAFLEGDRRPAALPHAVQDPPRARRAGRALGGLRARAPGVPRPGREPGRVPRDRVRLHGRDREARGGALLPLRRRDRLVGLQRPHARGHLRHGAHDAARRPQAARALHEAARGLARRTSSIPRSRVARRHRLPAGEPLAARHRPLPRRLPRGDRARRRAVELALAVPGRRLRRRAGRGTPGRAHGVSACGLAYVGRRPLGDGVPWLQLRRRR